MSARARAIREKNVVTKLVKDLNKRMVDFESAVDELKILKDSITEMHCQFTAQEAENIQALIRLLAELKDNKTKVLNEAAESVGKVIIPKDDLTELKNQVEKLKMTNQQSKASVDDVVKEKVKDLIKHRLKLQELEHKTEISGLQSQVKTYKKEIENFNKSFDRMVKELESQKKLTANLTMANRPSSSPQILTTMFDFYNNILYYHLV